ncbi:hypothetical protein GCM10017776_22140 [Streptomyces griseoluteus]|nr:hypothetical protein GCM10017776_22140 [Streptomyces griseoluteus]
MAEIGPAQAEADGAAGAESVAGFQYDETAPGAHEGGTGAQQFLKCGWQGGCSAHPFGQLMKSGEVGDPAGQPVLEQAAGGLRGGYEGWCASRGVRCGTGFRGGGCGRDSVGGSGNRGIDSGHFRRVRGVHGVRLSDRCVLLKSIANPHVILRRQQCLHMYTHS